MNSDKLNTWLAVLANIGVLAGVVFLAMEIRQNTSTVQIGNFQGSLALSMQLESWMLDSEFANLWYQGLSDHSQLTGPQKMQFDSYFGQSLNVWEFAFNAHQSEAMSDVTWNSWNDYYSSWIRQDTLSDLWKTSKRVDYSGAGGFLLYIDSVVQNE